MSNSVNPIGIWRRNQPNGESLEMMTVVGYDPATNQITSSAGRKISLTQLTAEYVRDENLDAVYGKNPFENLNLAGQIPAEIINRGLEPTEEKRELSDTRTNMNVDDMLSMKPAAKYQNKPQLTPLQIVIQSTIDATKSDIVRTPIEFIATTNLNFNLEQLLTIAKSINIDHEQLVEVISHNIEFDKVQLVDSIVTSIKKLISSKSDEPRLG